ncbi:MAG TPA: methyltransferase domain-containing protein [Acetobacteraceae bacterium]|nr:methyltransferase domain-containing protein [Acetobacteraceae bacterium]
MSLAFDPEAVRAFEHARWERAAPVFAASFATATSQFVEALLDAASVRAGTRVLDIACGSGVATAEAASRGAIAAGVDFSAAMLAVARGDHPAIVFLQGDAEALPCADAAFDAAVANFGVHHVPRPPLALAEAHRALATGGRIAVSFWAEPAQNIAWRLLFDAVRRHGDAAASGAPPPGGGFGSVRQILDALRDAGFMSLQAQLERRVWRHRDAASLVAALRAGTARMAALIDAQSPAALRAIVADIDANAAAWRDAHGLALPIAAVIAAGVKR